MIHVGNNTESQLDELLSILIYVCLLTEIEFDVGVEGQLTYA